MKFSKTAVKLAAAGALAVAGVLVGTAGADDIRKGPVEMGVSFDIEINDTAVIEVARANSPTRADLLEAGLAGADNQAVDPGTLGILKVTTNHDAWDVTMKTLYGGKLVSVGETTDHATLRECPSGSTLLTTGWDKGKCDAGGGVLLEQVPQKVLGKVQSLCYNQSTSTAAAGVRPGTTVYDTAQLVVKIGMCDLGSDLHPSANAGTYYAFGAPDAPGYAMYSLVEIASGDLLASRKYNHDGSDASGTDVSFATLIHDEWGGAKPVNGQSFLTGNTTFNTPLTQETNRHVQHFFVNVGLPNTIPFLEKKANNGTYEERFIFELSADF